MGENGPPACPMRPRRRAPSATGSPDSGRGNGPRPAEAVVSPVAACLAWNLIGIESVVRPAVAFVVESQSGLHDFLAGQRSFEMAGLIPWRRKQRTEVAPFSEFPFSLQRMRDEFDRLFNRMAGELAALREANGGGWNWGLEMEDHEDSVVVKAEAPGFEAGDFDLRVEGDRLLLSAAKKTETKDEKGEVREYFEQECHESVLLPPGVDRDNVEATYHNGVLTVTIAKMPEARAKKIAVKAE